MATKKTKSPFTMTIGKSKVHYEDCDLTTLFHLKREIEDEIEKRCLELEEYRNSGTIKYG